ncbi:acid protease [Piedraia hortae CBS 480.64]|uniref:Acid protease n=1 Tax=Piedraia hortae CBS 480.64 TaxID=1314780 RepID=A0A6A7C0G3_9PEZI|nr:acid protease [Piedraia hortae CBS 480.64]
MPQQLTAWALAILMSTAAMAAPTPGHPKVQKRTVTVPVHARIHNTRSPVEELHRTFAKFGFDPASLPKLDAQAKQNWVAPGKAPYGNRTCEDPSKAHRYDASDPFGSGGEPGGSDPLGSSGSDPLGSSGSDPMGSGGSGPMGSGGSDPMGSGASPYGGGEPSSGGPTGGDPSGSGSSPAGSGAPAPYGSSVPSASPSAPPPYGSSPPAPMSTGSGSKTGTVAATPDKDDAEYLENVKIGSECLSVSLDFDTGSSDFWIMSTKTSNAGEGHTLFDPSKSSTWKDYQGGSWQISYGDGSTATGTVGFDRVDIGGVVAEHQAIELADSVSEQFAKNPKTNGLVGLGFGNINTVKPEQQKTFFENVQGNLDQPVFTCDLRHNEAGSYTFGSIDNSHGDIHWVPIDSSKGWWQFDTKSYSINGQTQQCTTCHQAIADTGTSLMLMDQDIVDNYYKSVEGAQNDESQGGYVYDCNAKLPDFGVAIGDYMAIIPGSTLSYGQNGDKCFGGLQSNKGQETQILGDVFLKPFLAAFDGGQKRFGVAPKQPKGY